MAAWENCPRTITVLAGGLLLHEKIHYDLKSRYGFTYDGMVVSILVSDTRKLASGQEESGETAVKVPQ